MQFLQYTSVEATSAVKTLSVPEAASNGYYVEMQADGGPIRYTMDGTTTPSQTSGMVLLETSKQPKAVAIEDLVNMKFCRGSGTDATLLLHYCGASREASFVVSEATWQEGDRIVWQEDDYAEWQ